MILEGIVFELLIVFLTSVIQNDLQVYLKKTTSNWIFVLNIIGSILEIVASFADISVVWFEYDS